MSVSVCVSVSVSVRMSVCLPACLSVCLRWTVVVLANTYLISYLDHRKSEVLQKTADTIAKAVSSHG